MSKPAQESKMTLEFWFEFASTYSYLSAMRLRAVSQAAGIEVVWRPFLLGPIFAEQGWDDSPFNLYPAKGRYMWRDLERLCEGYGFEFQKPSVFPRNGLLAARVACAAEGEAWLPDFVGAVYVANFARDLAIDDPEVLRGLLQGVGADAAKALENGQRGETKAKLRAQTERAAKLGIFGAPSFVVGDELYWGNDRMGDAVAQCLLGG